VMDENPEDHGEDDDDEEVKAEDAEPGAKGLFQLSGSSLGSSSRSLDDAPSSLDASGRSTFRRSVSRQKTFCTRERPRWLERALTARKIFKIVGPGGVANDGKCSVPKGLEQVGASSAPTGAPPPHEEQQQQQQRRSSSLDVCQSACQSQRSLRAFPPSIADSFEAAKYSFDYARLLPEITRRPVARGCQAFVYRVDHESSSSTNKGGETYALKVLKPELAACREEMRAFQREVNMLSLIRHPNVCALVGVGTEPRQQLPCAMLEWVSQTVSGALKLKDVAKNPAVRRAVEKEWPSSRRLRLIDQLASALLFLHSGEAIANHCVLHRDLKPENYGVAADGSFKLLDFGLAVCLDLDEGRGGGSSSSGSGSSSGKKNPSSSSSSSSCSLGNRPKSSARFRLTGETGSLRYMSPEVGRHEYYGLGADVYSFGISAWEILALRGKPFAEMNAVMHRDLVINQGVRPKVPSTFDSTLKILLCGCWHPDQSKRPDFKEVRRLLGHNLNLKHPLTGRPIDALNVPADKERAENYARCCVAGI